jgi:hypothetical protein
MVQRRYRGSRVAALPGSPGSAALHRGLESDAASAANTSLRSALNIQRGGITRPTKIR